jgi:predicted ribosomally synthesized peptide with nif11-like leader
MSDSNLERFYGVILHDSAIQDQLKSSIDQDSFTNQLVELGSVNGYYFTASDVTDRISTGKTIQQTELSDEDLLVVAGGKSMLSIFRCDERYTTEFGPCTP